jgi:hypothetical protein
MFDIRVIQWDEESCNLITILLCYDAVTIDFHDSDSYASDDA